MKYLKRLIFIAIKLCSIVGWSMAVADEGALVDDGTATIVITVAPTFRDNFRNLAIGTTGFSPARSQTKELCLDSPVKGFAESTVKLKGTIDATRIRRNLFGDEGEKSEDEATNVLDAKDMHLVPSSKTAMVEQEIPFDVIYSDTTDFVSGRKAFFDPFCFAGTVLVDCSDRRWGAMLDVLRTTISFNDQEYFIASVITSMKNHKKELMKFAYYDKKDRDLVCRHLATVALPVLSKILDENTTPFTGTIQLVASNPFTHDFEIRGEGHVWNLLTLINAVGDKTYWFLDVTNRNFTNLSASPSFKDLEVVSVGIDGEMSKEPLKYSSWSYRYIRATKEKFNILPRKRKVLYDDTEAMERAARKALQKCKPRTHAYKFSAQ